MSTFDLGNNISILNKLPWFADARFATIAAAEASPVWDESKIVYIEGEDPHWYTYDSSGNCIPITNSTANMVNEDQYSRLQTPAYTSQHEINAAIEKNLRRSDLMLSSPSPSSITASGFYELPLINIIDNWHYSIPSSVLESLAIYFCLVIPEDTSGLSPEEEAMNGNRYSATITNSSNYSSVLSIEDTVYRNTGDDPALLSTILTIRSDDDNVKILPGESVHITFTFYYDSVVVTTDYLRNKPKRKQLEEFAPELESLTVAGDAVTWDVVNKGQAIAEVDLAANATLTLNNTVSGGAYLLKVTKTVVEDVQITLSGTFKKSAGTGFLTSSTVLLSGDQNADFLLNITRIGSVNYISVGS